MGKYSHSYRNDDIVRFAAQVTSIAGLLRELGLRPAGGNYNQIKHKLQLLKVDTSHWTGRGWSRGEQLKDWSQYARIANFKKHLLKYRGLRCEYCQLTEWRGAPIPLEVHHVDGNRVNNEETNLVLCCPNCHAQTDNYKNKKRVK